MAYPREVYLDEETENRLKSYLDEELLNHYAERAEHVADLMRWQKDYWAKPTTEKATFPFTGAATLVIPLDAIAVEAIYARAMTTFFAAPQFVSASAINADWSDVANPVERFLDNELLVNMKIRKPLGDCFLEAIKFGTMIGKVGYERIVRTAVREFDGIEQEFDVVVKDGAVFDAVSDSRFLMPFYCQDPQTATWCGEEHSKTPFEIIGLEQAGMFRPGTIIDPSENVPAKLKAWISNNQLGTSGQETGRQFEENQASLEKTTAHWPKRIDWTEHWMSFDIDQSGIEKAIVVHYHRESRTIMSIRYNWHADLRRPYRTGVYFPVEHRWRGIGICKMNEQFQREITTQHRQRLDNATLANMRMFKISKLSGYGPGEPIFPGKMWFLDDMDQLESVQLGDVYNSSYSNEQASLIISQQRTGVNEVTLGTPQAGTPGTATSDLARIQEGNKKFDLIFSNFKDFTDQIVVDTAAVVQQFGPRQLVYFQTAENGQAVQQYFTLPEELITNGLILRLRTSGQQHNDIIDRQNWQQVAGHLQAYYTSLLQIAQMTGNPELLQVIFTQALGASTEAMRQILETFNIRNVDRLIVKQLEALSSGSQANTNAGRIAPNAGTDPNAAMELITQAFSGSGANGNGTTNRIFG